MLHCFEKAVVSEIRTSPISITFNSPRVGHVVAQLASDNHQVIDTDSVIARSSINTSDATCELIESASHMHSYSTWPSLCECRLECLQRATAIVVSPLVCSGFGSCFREWLLVWVDHIPRDCLFACVSDILPGSFAASHCGSRSPGSQAKREQAIEQGSSRNAGSCHDRRSRRSHSGPCRVPVLFRDVRSQHVDR